MKAPSPVRALVVGSLVMDLSFRVPRRPEPGEVILADDFGTYRGGKGYDQAVALRRLGADVTLIGAVGDDAYGHDFLTSLDHDGIDTRRMVVLPEAQTSVAVPLVTPDGDVAFVHAPAANHLLRPEHLGVLDHYDVLLLQGEVPPETSLAAAARVAQQGGLVMLNPAPAHRVTPEMLAVAAVLTPNEVEARHLAKSRGLPEDDSEALARALAAEGQTVVITLGARGAAYAHAESSGHGSAPVVQAIDATGAGDSFCAALAVALVGGTPLPEAVRFACAAGALATMARGAEPGLPHRHAVERFIAEHES